MNTMKYYQDNNEVKTTLDFSNQCAKVGAGKEICV